jgi:DNA-binding MarR family transcriptional regulator
MSTVSGRPTESPGIERRRRVSRPPAATTAAELVGAWGSFGAAFGRWARAHEPEGGLSWPRLQLLFALHRHGPQIMAELSQRLGVTARNITALVDGLETEGLVRRRPHPSDRRATIVELTTQADSVPKIFAHRQAMMARIYSGLSETDQRELLRLILLLTDRLNSEAMTGEEPSSDVATAVTGRSATGGRVAG